MFDAQKLNSNGTVMVKLLMERIDAQKPNSNGTAAGTLLIGKGCFLKA